MHGFSMFKVCGLSMFLLIVVTLLPNSGSAVTRTDEFQIIHTGPGLTLHKEMFAMPFSYSNEYNGKRTEAIFQLSAKHRVFDTHFYFAYTQISFWQSYDIKNSSPFRDTNYNPELFYRFDPRPYGAGHLGLDLGFEHESNGQLMPLSRSWNLLYATPCYLRDNLLICVKLRYRVPEEGKESPMDAVGDDNPDITDYLGYSDLHVYYKFLDEHMIHFEMRGFIGSDKGGISLNYSYPVPKTDDNYLVLHLAHGYGESLMDYRKSINRVGVGLMFTR